MDATLSRRLAQALNNVRPTPSNWIEIVEASEVAEKFTDLPDWVQAFIRNAEKDNDKATDADITKAGRNVIDDALNALNKIPMVDDQHIAVPWPIDKRPKLNPEVWVDSEISAVTISRLVASQKLLTKSRVAFYIKNPGAIEQNRRAFANVYASDSRNVIVDGHHRLAAFWLLGAEVANVWFLEE